MNKLFLRGERAFKNDRALVTVIADLLSGKPLRVAAKGGRLTDQAGSLILTADG